SRRAAGADPGGRSEPGTPAGEDAGADPPRSRPVRREGGVGGGAARRRAHPAAGAAPRGLSSSRPFAGAGDRGGALPGQIWITFRGELLGADEPRSAVPPGDFSIAIEERRWR